MREVLWDIHLKIGFQPFCPRFSVFKVIWWLLTCKLLGFVSHYGQFSSWGLGTAGCLDQAILVLLVWPDSVLSKHLRADKLLFKSLILL